MKVVGFTGTHNGMTGYQISEVIRHLLALKEQGYGIARHGDCIGADAMFHAACVELGYKVFIHPPVIAKKRAFCKSENILPAKDYLVRNIDIVNGSDTMLATPFRMYEELRSGTWHAIRYAQRSGKSLQIVWPSVRS